MKRRLIIILAIVIVAVGLVAYYLYAGSAVSIVWDYVAIYEPGKLWDKAPPEPAYSGNPVVDVIEETRTAIQQQLNRPSNP